jgi:gluconolactonase
MHAACVRSLCLILLAATGGCGGGAAGPVAPVDAGVDDPAAGGEDARLLEADLRAADGPVVVDASDRMQDGADVPADARPDGPAAPGLGPAGAACPAGGVYGHPLPQDLTVTTVRGGFAVTEGPVWIAAQRALYFSEFGGGSGRIHKYTPADGKFVVLADKVGVNGLTIDDQGMILAASQDMQRVTRFDPVTGTRSQIPGADRYLGKPFNAVNDVIARADGNIYFSDPTFMQVGPGQGVTGFYRLAGGVVTRLGIGKQPNALGISLDGRWLYVTSSGGEPVRRFPLTGDGGVGAEGPSLAGPSESLAIDCAGNLYLSSDGKVRAYTAEGQPLGNFGNIPAGITNLTFGDDDGRTLYITARGALYKIRLLVPGLPS